jgi:hypothetical protein
MYYKTVDIHRAVTWHLLNHLDESQIEQLIEESDLEWARRGQRLFCISCLNGITSEIERIDRQGGHSHFFKNPYGVEYHVGCFAAAAGCRNIGPRTEQWSWFKGFTWQVALCQSCGVHLGWYFTSFSGDGDGDGFFGLILPQLTSAR